MGLGKTYSTSYLADSNNNTGEDGQVLISTATGINWVDGSGVTGGPFLPLAGGDMTGLISSYNAEALRVYRDNGYISGYKTDGTARNGYIQFNTGALHINSEQGSKYLILNPSGGKVGIGTSSPIGKLTIISEDTTANPAISIRQTNSASQGWDFDVENNNIGRLDISSIAVGNNKNARISILKASGNVGIGTTDPKAALGVKGRFLVDTKQ